MAGLLSNYVRFVQGVPKRLHFTDHAVVDKDIVDPQILITKTLTTLELIVDEEDFTRVAKTLSITADKFTAQMEPYLAGKTYRQYDYVVTLRGESYGRRYSVDVIPRPT